MNVFQSHSNQGTRVNVLSDLKQKEDLTQFVDLLSSLATDSFELVFYDAAVLPTEALVLMNEIALRKDLRIVTYQRCLGHYLNELGFTVKSKNSEYEVLEPRDYKVLALGGSADSLDKIQYLIPRLNPSSMTIFIVQHIVEDMENKLDLLLRHKTDYRVIMPSHLERIKPGTIYIAPPGRNMRVSNQMVYLTQDKKINLARPSIGALFESIALEYGREGILVLLCGYGEDGVPEMGTIKESGCTMIVENSEDCQAKALTQAAEGTHLYDHLLYLEEIGSFVSAATLEGKKPEKEQFDPFLEAVFKRYGYDYRGLQKPMLQRRLEKLSKQIDSYDFFSFQKNVLANKEIFSLMFEELSINVTELFRNAEQFRFLVDHVFSQLASFSNIRVWSVGCSTGEEVVSLAILLEEAGLLQRTQIYGSDLNPVVLGRAKNFLFSSEKIEASQGSYQASGGQKNLTDYFTKSNRMMQLKPEVSKRINYFRHSVVGDGRFNEFHLIICRNLLIYFNPQAQEGIFELLANSLHHSGFLTLGKEESLTLGKGERFFTSVSKYEKVFQWKQEA